MADATDGGRIRAPSKRSVSVGGTPGQRGTTDPAQPPSGPAEPVSVQQKLTVDEILRSWPKLFEPIEPEPPPDPLLAEIALAFQPHFDIRLATGPASLARVLEPKLKSFSPGTDVAFIFCGGTLASALAKLGPDLRRPAGYAAVLTGYTADRWRASVASPLQPDAFSVLMASVQTPTDLYEGGAVAAVHGLLEAQKLTFRGSEPPQIVLIADQQKVIRVGPPPLDSGAIERIHEWAERTSAHLTLIGTAFHLHDGRADPGTRTVATAFANTPMRVEEWAGYFRSAQVRIRVPEPELDATLSEALLTADAPEEDLLLVVDVDGAAGEKLPRLKDFVRKHEAELAGHSRRISIFTWSSRGSSQLLRAGPPQRATNALASVRRGPEFPGARDIKQLTSLIATEPTRPTAAKRLVFWLDEGPRDIPYDLVLWAEQSKAKLWFVGPGP